VKVVVRGMTGKEVITGWLADVEAAALALVEAAAMMVWNCSNVLPCRTVV
jgi:hypothetical protein